VLDKAYDEVFYQKPASGDYKYDADVLADSIAEQLGKGSFTDLPQTHQTQIYNSALKRVQQDLQINRAKKIAEKNITDLEQKIELQMFDPKGKKGHASGGRAGLRGGGRTGSGLNYLLGEDDQNVRVPFGSGSGKPPVTYGPPIEKQKQTPRISMFEQLIKEKQELEFLKKQAQGKIIEKEDKMPALPTGGIRAVYDRPRGIFEGNSLSDFKQAVGDVAAPQPGIGYFNMGKNYEAGIKAYPNKITMGGRMTFKEGGRVPLAFGSGREQAIQENKGLEDRIDLHKRMSDFLNKKRDDLAIKQAPEGVLTDRIYPDVRIKTADRPSKPNIKAEPFDPYGPNAPFYFNQDIPELDKFVKYDDGTIYYRDTGEYYNAEGVQVNGPSEGAKIVPKTLEAREGGRVALDKGGPPNPGRRNFMKLAAGLASLPFVGKFFKLAKPAAKIAKLKNTTTTMPAWFPDLVDKIINKGVGKKIDADLMQYKVKDLPDVALDVQSSGKLQLKGKNAYNEEYIIDYEPPGYEVLDYKTGKAVKTKGDFVATDTQYRRVGSEGDDFDVDAVNVDTVDELLGGSSSKLENFAKGKKGSKKTIGQKRIDDSEYYNERADVHDPYEGMDSTDFAKGGIARTGYFAGLLAKGGAKLGKFSKSEVLIQMMENTLKGSKDPYVTKNFPTFIKEMMKKPELANSPKVWNFFTKGLPKNQRLVVHSDDSVDFWKQSDFGPHNIETTNKFMKKHGFTRDEAVRIQNMSPEDQTLEMKRLETIADRDRTKQASGGLAGMLGE
jgi:hypothetical protein